MSGGADSKKERTLIYFPVIHTEDDMGTFREPARDANLEKLGKDRWALKVDAIKTMWGEIERAIDGMGLNLSATRLYQDSLPVCGSELEIVTELATAGSLNHHLLLRLVERGATIMGTESAELLLQEYELAKRILAVRSPGNDAGIEASQKDLMELSLRKRDRFIAERIDKTLLAGETGVLFLGALHFLEDGLKKDIRVIYPIGRPQDHSGGKDK